MPKKSLRYLIFNELLIADDDWFDMDICPQSTGCRNEDYYDFLAGRVVKMLKKEKKLWMQKKEH